MGVYTIFFFSTCRTTIFPFSTLTDTSDTLRLLKLCSMAVFSFSVISTFKDSPPYLVSPPPSCGRGRHMAIFPLRLSRPGLRLKTHHYIVIIATHLSVFSEHCHSWLSHDERSQIVRALPDILWTMQDLNLRSLPLSVKRRNPPRPMVHIYRHLDGMLRVGSGFPGACLWSSPKLYDHGFTVGALFFPDGYSYSLPVLPHRGCDPPARTVG